MHHLTTYKEEKKKEGGKERVKQTSGSAYLKLNKCSNAESHIKGLLTHLWKRLQVLHDAI